MTVRRDALRLGLVASAAALVGRGTARAADALTIEPDGATIFAKRINFDSRYGELLTLWTSGYAIGIQPYTSYARSAKNFAWYQGGTHSDTELDPGKDGIKMMWLTPDTLTVSNKFVGMGAATLKNSLTVEGAATLQTSLTVAGAAGAKSLRVSPTTAGANVLDAQAAPRTGDHPTGLALYVTADSGEASNGVEFRHSNGSQGIGFGYNTIYATGTWSDQPLILKARGKGTVQIEGQRGSEDRLSVAGGWNLCA
jgi:hypothetical protein